MRLLLGIDVGWSARRRSCGLATRGGVGLRNGFQFREDISVGQYRLSGLQAELERLARRYPDLFQKALLVIDGPIGPALDAIPSRSVDGEFSRGGFNNRAPGYPITHSSGLQLSLVTAQILYSLKNLVPSLYPWLGGTLPSDRFVVVETNPTPAMAVLIPQQDIASLPSRNHPKYIDGTLVRAKSDWYWRLGAGRYASRILGAPSIAAETNHERVAALFALSLASALVNTANDGSAVAALGDRDGIYLVPSDIDESWKADVDRIGIVYGSPNYQRRPTDSSAPTVTKRVEAPAVVVRAKLDGTSTGRQRVLVVLNDNGGLNTVANPWLEGLGVPCQLHTQDGVAFTIQAPFAGRCDMYRISPTALHLARRFAFKGNHLSKTTSMSVEAIITSLFVSSDQKGDPVPR